MKRRNLFMSATIMCGLFVIAFTFNNGHIIWVWTDQKLVAIVLGIAALIFGIQWRRHQRNVNQENQKS